MRRRHTIALALAAGIALVASPGAAAPVATTIDSLTAQADGLVVNIAGTATLGGDEVVVGTDATNDNIGGANTASLGLDLLSASVGQPDPSKPDLVFTLKLNGMTAGGIPELVGYNWDIRVDGTVWRLTSMRTRALVTQNAEPYAALFTCTAGAGGTSTCTQNKLLPVTYTEDGSIAITLPMVDVAANPGSVIEAGAAVPIGISGTVAGRVSITNLFDTMTHEPYTVPTASARIGLAPAGTTPNFATGVAMSGGGFAGSLTAPAAGAYTAGAQVCFGTNCATQTVDVTAG